jgi:uncharacterized membrane protein YphA (DoxX/SURF4 family)
VVAEAVGTLSLAVELFIGALLLGAGILKVRAGKSAVVAAVATYEIGRSDHQRVFARLLPWIEIGVGAALVLGLARDLAALGGGALLAAFEVAMARSLSGGRQHPCGCGSGRRSKLTSWTLVSRNGVLIAAVTAAEVARNAPAQWSLATFALALVFLVSSLSAGALRLRSRAGEAPERALVPTTSRT